MHSLSSHWLGEGLSPTASVKVVTEIPILLSTNKEMISAKNVTDVLSHCFVVHDKFILPILKAFIYTLTHYIQHEIFYVFSLCVVAELFVAPLSSHPFVPHLPIFNTHCTMSGMPLTTTPGGSSFGLQCMLAIVPTDSHCSATFSVNTIMFVPLQTSCHLL